MMSEAQGTASAQAHPNIAFVKYWGKFPGEGNKPAVSSLSLTLSELRARTSVNFDPGQAEDSLSLNGVPIHSGIALTRVQRCLDDCRRLAGVKTPATVVTTNNFPTGAGLASSAAGFAALVVAACAALKLQPDQGVLSVLARRASGSAARSIFGGFVELAAGDEGHDPAARQVAPPEHWPLVAHLLIVSTEPKSATSTLGMQQTAQSSPFYPAWIKHQETDLESARTAVLERDFAALTEVAEASCLKMHALILSTRPSILYWQPATLACMHRIHELRASGLPVFFTIDAGPQVKAFCEPERAAEILAGLQDIPGVREIVSTEAGPGARTLSN